MLSIFVYCCAFLIVLLTGVPFIRSGAWWIRIWDFPRTHLFFLGLVLLLIYPGYGILSGLEVMPTLLGVSLYLMLWLSVLYQGRKILLFTTLHPKEVKTSNGGKSLSLLVSNVCYKNNDYEALRDLIVKHDPDLIALCEPDDDWDRHCLRDLERKYPHGKKEIRPDGHGIALLSKYPLHQAEIHYLVSDERPSISATMSWDGGEPLDIWVTHPAPPAIKMDTNERKDSRPRDAELVLVAEEVSKKNCSTVVTGDFNDAGWSETTSRFKEISGLKDPRVGRGFYNTFPVKYPYLRYPIDHIFLSENIGVKDLLRLSDIESDHFPMLLRFTADSGRRPQQSSENTSRGVEGEIVRKGEQQAEKYKGADEQA